MSKSIIHKKRVSGLKTGSSWMDKHSDGTFVDKYYEAFIRLRQVVGVEILHRFVMELNPKAVEVLDDSYTLHARCEELFMVDYSKMGSILSHLAKCDTQRFRAAVRQMLADKKISGLEEWEASLVIICANSALVIESKYDSYKCFEECLDIGLVDEALGTLTMTKDGDGYFTINPDMDSVISADSMSHVPESCISFQVTRITRAVAREIFMRNVEDKSEEYVLTFDSILERTLPTLKVFCNRGLVARFRTKKHCEKSQSYWCGKLLSLP